MKNIFKFTLFLGFAGSLFWLSNQRNLSYAAAPYSNIRTSFVNTGYFLRTNDFGTNESFVGPFRLYDATGTNLILIADGSNTISIVSAASTTNIWPGPTNIIDVRTNHYFYKTIVPVDITGIYNADNSKAWNPLLKIFNGGSSNITITIEPNIRTPFTDTNVVTLTNGDLFISSYDVSDGQTNVIYRIWH